MSITRTAWTDDDGTGTTGTVINNAAKTQLYDQIDALLANIQTPSFVAGDYTGSGSMTVTVDAGDVLVLKYQVTNKLMTIWFELTTFSIGGTPSTAVRRAIPGGFTALSRARELIHVVDNGTNKTGVAFVNTSSTFIEFYVDLTLTTSWAASTNNSGAFGKLTFPIN